MDQSTTSSAWQKLPSQVMGELAVRERALRKQHGLSQEELAQASGVSLGSLRRFEHTGLISLESLLKLAFALDALGAFDMLFPERTAPKSLDDLFNDPSNR